MKTGIIKATDAAEFKSIPKGLMLGVKLQSADAQAGSRLLSRFQCSAFNLLYFNSLKLYCVRIVVCGFCN